MRTPPTAPAFTVAQARVEGSTSASLRWATDHDQLVRVIRGTYAQPGLPDALRLDRAAAARYPEAALSHASAGRLWAIPLISAHDIRPVVTVPPRANADLPGIHCCRARLRDHDVVSVNGILTTSVARTVVDLARHHKLITSVPALDHVLHNELATADEIRDVLDFCRNWPGARRARQAALLCDSRSESPLESVSRLTLPRIGLPLPEPQVLIVDRAGVVVARSDFYWDEAGVVGEADGLAKYAQPGVIEAQSKRHERLDDLHAEVTRWGWQDVWTDHALWISRVRSAFARGAARDGAGLPRLWTPVSSSRVALL